MKLLCVVQRYGPEVTGGSEALCRAMAQRLAARHDVSVATSCATDYVTWANVLPPGLSKDGAVTVHRFPSSRERPLHEFWRLSDRVFDDVATEEEQRRWFRLNGPELPGLLSYLQARGRDFDRVLFFTFRYAPSWFGLPLVADRAVLVPTAEHEELIRSSTILAPFFRLPRSYLFLTPEEETMIGHAARAPLPPSAVIGSGIDPATSEPMRDAIDALGIPRDYLLYVGRVDRNKGCDALMRHYAAYAERAGSAALPLILAGPLNLPVPSLPGLRALGRVDDAVRDALMAHARALVMPSPFESLSLVVLEAWNRGTPVIVNARCDVLLGQVRRANGGLYYRTSEDFAGAVQRLAADADLARAFGRQGLAYVDREYRWPLVLERIESILQQ
ncbi:MAG: glycosyltransferase family 4 protein [Vicinamibacteraceae bacterium]